MTRPSSRHSIAARAVAPLVAVLGLAACTSTGPTRQEARVVINADPDSVPIQIVTSNNFACPFQQTDAGSPACSSIVFGSADTTVQTPPFDHTYDISATQRFLVILQFPPTATDTPSVQATIDLYIDGQEKCLAGQTSCQVKGDLASKPLQSIFLGG